MRLIQFSSKRFENKLCSVSKDQLDINTKHKWKNNQQPKTNLIQQKKVHQQKEVNIKSKKSSLTQKHEPPTRNSDKFILHRFNRNFKGTKEI